MAQNPTFVITMADGREMKGELYPETAPQSVGNFIALANSGFYDGLIFHRVIPGFMIQGGDPKGTGIGGPGYHIKGEFAMNGVNNPLKHTYGVLSMARSMMRDSAGCQFFAQSLCLCVRGIYLIMVNDRVPCPISSHQAFNLCL